jgi:hypothetical protein
MNTASLSTALQRNNTPWYARQVIHLLQEIEHGCLHLELPNGMQLTVGQGTPDAYLEFKQWSAVSRRAEQGRHRLRRELYRRHLAHPRSDRRADAAGQ